MAERTTIRLDELIDPFEARVVVTLDTHGHVSGARFDLGGLPRVDALLVGRPVADVPRLVERLCGICPAAHHLAGVRALDTLGDSSSRPPPKRSGACCTTARPWTPTPCA